MRQKKRKSGCEEKHQGKTKGIKMRHGANGTAGRKGQHLDKSDFPALKWI